MNRWIHVANQHCWLRSAHREDRAKALAGLDVPPILATADAHRRLRGPYTAAGTLLRAVVPTALEHWPELVARHDIEILAAAGELRDLVPASRQTLMSAEPSATRTHFYTRGRTLCLANGLAEFFRDHAVALGGGPYTLVVDNAHEADPTDQEFLAVLLRRLDPEVLTMVVGTTVQQAPSGLSTALRDHTRTIDSLISKRVSIEPLASAYVDSDGTSDDPAELSAYEALPQADRASLHDARAAVLTARDEVSLTLGAIPYHREHGSDPAGAGVAALRAMAGHCASHGFYDAALDAVVRARAIAAADEADEFIAKSSTALIMLGRLAEAEPLLAELRNTAAPLARINAAYVTATIYTKHRPAPLRDHERARAVLVQAMCDASRLLEGEEREFAQVNGRIGLALAEFNLGNPSEALRLLKKTLAVLDRCFGPDEHTVYRVLTRKYVATMHAALGEVDKAIAGYTDTIALDPNDSTTYFELAALLRRADRPGDAVRSYDEAIRLSPPYPEVYYNRADTRLELGDVDGALADFGYVLELDPAHVDTHLNMATLYCELGDLTRASQHIDTGLALAADDSRLLCLKGRLLAEDSDAAGARAALTAAVEADPGCAEAWAMRGALAYEAGNLLSALDDLGQALELGDDPAIRFNRAVALREAGRHAEAIEDYDRVLAATPDPDAWYGRGLCHLHFGDSDLARRDFLACLDSSPDHIEQVSDVMPELVIPA
ncbi:tetratricopeptide repeat protein [Streptosporangium sp. G11]|uniref:tetratricopeptide repeat protein n=1 Tax=Streptosporangium sp. G11 TaxID=3436926 RepID=UPI003EBAAE5C